MTKALEIPEYMAELSATISTLPLADLDRLVAVFHGAYREGRAIFTFGNGGSAALASHMACDLGKGTAPASGKRLRAISLADNVALMTAWANDTRYENIFAEQLENLLQPGDVAFAISGSGNSPNILAALHFARCAGGITAGMSGFDGGKMKALCEVCAVVSSSNMQIVEDLHLSIAHSVFRALQRRIEETNRLAISQQGVNPLESIARSPAQPIHRRAASVGKG
jgi:D-sedoheptulose 7-phosphate isomerase